MLQLISNWLKGPKEYFTGVVIYKKLPETKQHVLALFAQGPTPLSKKVLSDELSAAALKLKANKDNKPTTTGVKIRSVSLKPQIPEKPANIVVTAITNTELYNACKQEADIRYKEVMNMRAELFALARQDDFMDPNTPDRIEARRKLSLNVVKGFQVVSALYDKADYVKDHGRLPDQEEDEEEEVIEDIMVKQALDNARKNYSKLKNRPVTPDRIILMQKHEDNIKKLEERWLLLKPKK